jgi:16S rRNA (cytidine1402-2'-O)-methyltransferase
VTSGVLYIVGTPIGNLEDLSLRAARILRSVDVVAAEDTRTAKRLLDHVDALGRPNMNRKLISYFEGNEAERSDEIVRALLAGNNVAVISEAGMPGISDPGARAVDAAIEANARVEVIPGPSAVLAALVASGLPTDRFTFFGFPPRDDGPRRELFGTLGNEVATLVFYEAPDRVGATLADLAAALGPGRRAALARELTKIYEEHVRGTLSELAAKYAETSPRGECTLVVEGGTGDAPSVDIEAELRKLLAEGLGPKDAAQRLVVKTGKPRRQLYQLALSLQREQA